MRLYLIVLIALLLAEVDGNAQDSVRKPNELSAFRYISHDYDNDVFTNTDIYYTQGIRYELVFPALRKNPLSHALLGFRKNSVRHYGITLDQKCYTPTHLRSDSILHGDRPYASVLFAGAFLTSNDEANKQRLKSELDLGVTGHCALCDDEQKAIHRVLVDPIPQGWGYQIGQDVVINYSLTYDKGIINAKYVNFILEGKAEAGTLNDEVTAAGLFRLGKMYSYFSAIRAGENAEAKKFSFYGFARAWVEGVGYNATLQGGVFDQGSVYTIPNRDVERLVYGYQYGLIFSYKKLGLEYSLIHITPEFRTGMMHAWGKINITVAF